MATFRSPFIRKDATRGSRPLDGRLSLASLFTPSDDLGALPGVVSGLTVAGVASIWAYDVSAGHAVTSRAASDGANTPGLDGVTRTRTVAAAPGSGSRWDLIWIRQRDVDAADTDSNSVIDVTEGTPGGSPSKPYGSVPTGALVLAEAQVGAGATGTLHANVVITQVAKRVAARGGIVPTTAAAFGSGAYVGQYIDDPTLGLLRWNGSAWVAVVGIDPGWTTVTSLGSGWTLATPWTGILVRRRFGHTEIEGRVTGTGGAANTIFTLASGFRPDISTAVGDVVGWIGDGGSAAGPVRLQIFTDGRFVCASAVAVAGMSLHVRFPSA